MYKPSWFRGKLVIKYKYQAKRIGRVIKKSNLLFFIIALVIFATMISLWNSQTTAYAHAAGPLVENIGANYSVFEKDTKLFDAKEGIYAPTISSDREKAKKVETKKASIPNNLFADNSKDLKVNTGNIVFQIKPDLVEIEKSKSNKFAEKLYLMVGETPIKEMIPFISERDERVAAFLVGIAKKESSFGLASPSKDGKTCFNYWGYKGSGERGTGMGYACFASAEEAIKRVGDRIEVLVDKDRNTPARMVDTWKCGVSCAGDPGAKGWTSTVALYFNQIVDQNS